VQSIHGGTKEDGSSCPGRGPPDVRDWHERPEQDRGHHRPAIAARLPISRCRKDNWQKLRESSERDLDGVARSSTGYRTNQNVQNPNLPKFLFIRLPGNDLHIVTPATPRWVRRRLETPEWLDSAHHFLVAVIALHAEIPFDAD